MIRKLTISALSFVLMLSTAGALVGQEQAKQVPKEVSAIAGTYKGAWTIFGVDEAGQSVKRASWTDVIKGENPVVKGDRAYVTVTDEMTFEGGRIPPRKTQGMEGYFINKDGSLGDYFFEGAGQVYRFQRLAKDTWAYVVPADPRELAQLGFANVVSGQHALIKVVTSEQGVETHRISRVTTVNWKDAEGKERWTQFVSMQGFHQRQAQ